MRSIKQKCVDNNIRSGGKMKEKRCSYRVVICINDLPNQSVEDMQLNAQGYIKDDIEMDNLYIEDIIKIEEWEEK